MAPPSAAAPTPKPRNWTPFILIGVILAFCVCGACVAALVVPTLLVPVIGNVYSSPVNSFEPTPIAILTAVPTRPDVVPRTPTAQVVSSSITAAVMARDTQGDNKDPVGVTDVYSPTQRIFHAVVTVESLPSGSKMKAVWTAVDVGSAAAPNSKIDEFELTTEGSRNVDFTLTVGPSGRWPVGRYKVDIFLNGKLDRTLNFRVQ